MAKATSNSIVIVGAGDHGRVVLDIVRSAGISVAGFIEAQVTAAARARRAIDGVPVLGSLHGRVDWLQNDGLEFVVAIGQNHLRSTAYERCLELGLSPRSIVHPSAVQLGGSQVGLGTQVCAAAVLGVDARVGVDAIVNTAASLDHDCEIRDHAFVAPGARLAGRVIVEVGAHVGIGAIIREGTTIGAWSFVAAGAVVVSDVAPGSRVAGVPARPMERQ